MAMIVDIAKEFKFGNFNTSAFKDIPFMTDEELALVFQFMQDVEDNKPLRGKNKPSWQDSELNDLPYTNRYRANNLWHYHCGGYPPSKNFHPTIGLKLNLFGETSDAVIHYQKVAEDHIFIVGYSPKHNPFPKETDEPNPLLTRTK
ncbi:hypothetical protein [Lonepinella koalarum]|uniref:hypothetical protein n=1 Tax=Lonepinella koalarum TaxID=53417 RepID=UPI003F6DDC5E